MGLTEKVERMILSALESMEVTSANPTHINRLIQVNNIEVTDLEKEVNDLVKIKPDNETKKIKTDIQKLKEGNVGALAEMSSKQFNNIKSMSTDPFQFLIGAIGKKLGKSPVAKAGPAGLIAFLAIEVGKFIANEFFKPGRLFDVRFREMIDNQVIKFLERKEQQELKQGFRQVITTTLGGLRGNSLAGQIGGNFYYPERIPNNFLDHRIIVPETIKSQDMRGGRNDVGFGKPRPSKFGGR